METALREEVSDTVPVVPGVPLQPAEFAFNHRKNVDAAIVAGLAASKAIAPLSASLEPAGVQGKQLRDLSDL